MKKRPGLFAILITIVFVFLLWIVSIYGFGDYGFVVFFLGPLLLGFLPSLIYSRFEPVNYGKSQRLGFSALGVSVLVMLAFAFEGLVCIVMASPILAILVYIGCVLGWWVSRKTTRHDAKILSIIAITSIATMSFDVVNHPDAPVPVRTTVIIDAPIETVWNNVVTFDTIPEPTDWIFSTGIAYPTHATINGRGEGAIRYCQFTTGSFVEPITTWNEPNLLAFGVTEQPIPMNEFNPFWDIHPKHLDGYFKSHKGQFKLTKLGKNKTKLEGTTWYTVDLSPEFYWKEWSEFIIHRIHKRVLNHIKDESTK